MENLAFPTFGSAMTCSRLDLEKQREIGIVETLSWEFIIDRTNDRNRSPRLRAFGVVEESR